MTQLSARRIRRGLLAAAPVCALALGACNLDVATPDVIQPGSTEGESALPTRLNGAIGDFALAFSGFENSNSGEGIALLSGLMSDEFIATDYFDTHAQVDTRSVVPSNGSNSGVLYNIMRALVSAQGSADAYTAAGKQTDIGRARALNLVGMSYVLVAENYCSGVPFSTINPDGTFNFGASKSTAEMLQAAIARFDEAAAIAQQNADDQQYFTALVGKGRAQIDANQPAQAATTVASVPLGFSFETEQGTSDARIKSGLFYLTFISTRFTTANREGTNGLNFVAANDPRVATEDLGGSPFDAGTPLHAPLKFSSYSSPTPIATGVEAYLIRAEAALRAGNYGGASGTLALLNQIRSDAGLTPLTAAVGATAQQDQLFRERAFWLFGTAHRLGDLRRLMSQYNRTQNQVFPIGNYFKGGAYGNQVALMVPQEEGLNPNYNPASCDPTKP